MNYQEALEFIGEVRAGISWERFSMLAVRHFGAFLDMLADTEEARAFLAGKRIDRRYVVEYAEKVLERAHFNPGNDHYLTLGLSHGATADKIHDRWRELIVLYHPDGNRRGDELAARCARKINEAYNVLKVPAEKRRYDQAVSRKQVPQGSGGDTSGLKHRPHPVRPLRSELLSPGARKLLAKAILPLAILAACLLILIIFLGNGSAVTLPDGSLRSTEEALGRNDADAVRVEREGRGELKGARGGCDGD